MSTSERLGAPCRHVRHQRLVRARPDDQQSAGQIGCGVDLVSGRLQGEEHVLAILAGNGLLHLVDDEHDVALGLTDQFDEDFCECDAAGRSQTVQLDAHADACCAKVHSLDPAQLLQKRRGGLLEFGGR